MAKISDNIEGFIIKTLGDETEVDISRNELASFFACAPSQINYVLETRFTLDRGFSIESHRGGGGFIRIARIDAKTDDNVPAILESIGESISHKRVLHIMDKLVSDGLASSRDYKLVEVALSDSSLTMPLSIRDLVRAVMFKNILIFLIRNREEN